MGHAVLLNFIDSIPREVFHEVFVKKVGSTKLFSRFATDPLFTSDEDKTKFRLLLQKAGIPADLIATDHDLLYAAKTIMARAVKLR